MLICLDMPLSVALSFVDAVSSLVTWRGSATDYRWRLALIPSCLLPNRLAGRPVSLGPRETSNRRAVEPQLGG